MMIDNIIDLMVDTRLHGILHSYLFIFFLLLKESKMSLTFTEIHVKNDIALLTLDCVKILHNLLLIVKKRL